MLGAVAKKIFGSRNDRLVKKYLKTAQEITNLEATIENLSDDELQAKTAEFKQQLADGKTLKDIQAEAFAVVREASKRVLEMRHYDVQLVGAMVLNDGNIAEMKTGEGKTLVATLAVYLNALSGDGVHVITVNDYLATRDSEFMSRLYGFLGLSTGVIVGGLNHDERQKAYAADVTYGTNNEFGFDYLRDNMAFQQEERVQRGLNFAIVDEVDSILIDEARTPLIISGPTQSSPELYATINKIIPKLSRQEPTPEPDEFGPGDFNVDEKGKQVHFSEDGMENAENLLIEAGILEEGGNLYDTENITILHHLNAALRAHALFQKNVDYIVQGDEIVIVDEFTGRTMPGRRWSEGLHQAVEAKEGVEIQPENQTLASITFQNYFRLYNKLSGMTGTADTEAFEFQEIYGLEVVVIPTNTPMVREDANDLVFMTESEKYAAIVKEIAYSQEHKRPALVGTASIETSEIISNELKKNKIKHEVLNAKQHEREANIIENAGLPGAVTIATNMAGRGTDIVLGGSLDAELQALGENATPATVEKVKTEWRKRHDEVLAAGGLHIIGTERHESRRIDNQLRGRAGRQGDPGSSRFFLSLEDSLMRIFASDRVKGIMQKLGMEKGQAIEAGLVSKSIENAQRKVEAHNFDIRKNLLEYDDVANDQRKVVYEQRVDLLESEDVKDNIDSFVFDVVENTISRFIPPGSIDEQWDTDGLTTTLAKEFNIDMNVTAMLEADDDLHEEPLRQKIHAAAATILEEKEELVGEEGMRQLERNIMLHFLDQHWKEHLAAMDHLRQSVGLRGYAQKNPKQEYKKEGFELFTALLDKIKEEVVSFILKIEVAKADDAQEQFADHPDQEMEFNHPSNTDFNLEPRESEPFISQEEREKVTQTYQREGKKVGRNDPCPCGSGKKYKQCHGKLS
ncbi:MAG: Protein export cytoplasm protein SecA ATPase RNA helicase (TC 3.A.5.1.1) [uncultured Thiotrichaceae bacterium]|uniref:Protein translocase subunit SecA n=1 Tax=uncultured Thiotrichaceae bacterium TaxID=298394 RepID=A0A6S6T1R1_9GAMM|nr:MAG: Protein export cytoplasm protein SecA ATPase RNA helicase (TC 3.A.5.1.1) [uncultured Thiotrichaceae bacterium]